MAVILKEVTEGLPPGYRAEIRDHQVIVVGPTGEVIGGKSFVEVNTWDVFRKEGVDGPVGAALIVNGVVPQKVLVPVE